MPRQRRDIPWLEQRDNGVFYANWYNAEQGRTERESLGTREPGEAAKAFGRFLLEGPKASRHRGDAGLGVRQGLDDYIREHVEQLDDKGRPLVADQTRQKNIVVHLKTYFGDTTFKSIGPLESRAYTATRRAGVVGGGKKHKGERAKGSDATVRRELNLLVAAANHAIKWSRLTLADMPRIELPSEERGNEEVEWLTKEELQRGIRAAEAMGQDDLRDFILVAYYTAARKRSIERLTRFQVDLANGRINLMIPGSKATKKRRPVVPIYAEIRPAIERRMEKAGELLFGGHDFYREFVALFASIGIEAHPHMLRHSRASHLLHDGEDIFKVARLLGDTVATVERVYAHSSPEFLATTSGVKESGK